MRETLLEFFPKKTSLKSISFKAPAKLNLYLNVLGKRKDGYHNICSVIERISLFDELRLIVTEDSKIRLFCSQKELGNPSNLAFRAVKLIKDKFNIKEGLDIILNKNIPQGSGLGGASSDAAFVLLGLNRLFKLNLDIKELFKIGKLLGSDVNFFLAQSRFALVLRRGDRVFPINSSLKLRHLLIFGKEPSSTQEVYQNFNLKLTKYIDNAKLIIYSLENKDQDLLGKLLFNSLTKTYLEVSKEARAIFKVLSEIEDCPFLLSGSGSTISVLLNRKDLKEKVKQALKNLEVKILEVTTF